MRITRRQLRRIIGEEFNQTNFPYSEGDEIEIIDPRRGTTYVARVVRLLKNGVNVDDGTQTFQVKYQDIVDNIGPGTKVVGGEIVREMRITRRQLRQIIAETIEEKVFWKEGDLVRKVDYYGDGRGGDYKKTVGDEIGQVIEIDEDIDGTQYTVLLPDGSTIMDVGDSFEAAK